MARDVAIYFCREITGETGVSLGRHFSGITGSGIAIISRLRTKLKPIESLMGGRIESEEKYLIFESPCPALPIEKGTRLIN